MITAYSMHIQMHENSFRTRGTSLTALEPGSSVNSNALSDVGSSTA
jgi:hypothetical protein